jgi:hypothetical protein
MVVALPIAVVMPTPTPVTFRRKFAFIVARVFSFLEIHLLQCGLYFDFCRHVAHNSPVKII